MASISEQVRQLKQEMAEQRLERTQALEKLRSEVHAVGDDVSEMLAQFREERATAARVGQAERKQRLQELRDETQSITGEVADMLAQFRNEHEATSQAELENRTAFVEQVRGQVEALLNDAREARTKAHRASQADRQETMKRLSQEVAQLIAQSRSERGSLMDSIRADTKRILETAREEQAERRADIEAMHRAWTEQAESPISDIDPAPTSMSSEASGTPTTDAYPETPSQDATQETPSPEAPSEQSATQDAEASSEAPQPPSIQVPGDASTPTEQEADAQEPDDFSVLQGVGPKIADELRAAGYATFKDIAVASPKEIRENVEGLPPFVNVASWIDQASKQVKGAQ